MLSKFLFSYNNILIKSAGIILLIPFIYIGIEFNDVYLFILLVLLILSFSLLAKKYPLPVIILYLITALLPDILLFVTTDEIFFLIDGIRASDIFLIAMSGAILINIFYYKTKNENDLKLYIPIIIISLLFLFEIVRNYDVYGISAFGEFRTRYLILIVPIFIAIFFDTPSKRKKLFVLIIKISLLITLLFIPLIGFINGWKFGEENRFLSANVHLGFIYGLTALYIGTKYKLIDNNIALVIKILTIVMLIADSHRSVWLSGVVIILILISIKEIIIKIKILKIISIVAFFFIILFFISGAGSDLIEYILRRASAFINPMEDPTSKWRLLLWAAQIEKFLNNPFLGEGFGGYWSVYISEFKTLIETSPHSLYVQSLVKIGLIGLSLYLLIIFKIYKKLKKAMSIYKVIKDPEYALVILAFVFLIASHVFYLVYTFENYTWIYVGLGMAVLMNKKLPDNNYAT